MFASRFNIARIMGDPKKVLKQRVWGFHLLDSGTPTIEMTDYTEQERATPRHKWVVVRGFAKTNSNYDRRQFNMRMTLDEVELPDDVAQDAKTIFMEKLAEIKVTK